MNKTDYKSSSCHIVTGELKCDIQYEFSAADNLHTLF